MYYQENTFLNFLFVAPRCRLSHIRTHSICPSSQRMRGCPRLLFIGLFPANEPYIYRALSCKILLSYVYRAISCKILISKKRITHHHRELVSVQRDVSRNKPADCAVTRRILPAHSSEFAR